MSIQPQHSTSIDSLEANPQTVPPRPPETLLDSADLPVAPLKQSGKCSECEDVRAILQAIWTQTQNHRYLDAAVTIHQRDASRLTFDAIQRLDATENSPSAIATAFINRLREDNPELIVAQEEAVDR